MPAVWKVRIPMRPKPSWLRLSLALIFTALFGAEPELKLRLSPRQPSGTEIAVVEISLESPKGKEPTALQWEMTIAGAGLTFVQDVLPVSADSLSPGKAIRCGSRRASKKAQTSFCMLMGGVEPIPAGRIARIQLTGPAPAEARSVQVQLDQIIAVYKDLRRIALKPSGLTVPISIPARK